MKEEGKLRRALTLLLLLLLSLANSFSPAAARGVIGLRGVETPASLLPPRRLLPRELPPPSGPSKGGNEVGN
ncbi:unnamed protein product [Spirodela intermedia]|uniref:Uncharacterized protein n=1 Tax=Spirodela intermedia TaxID=51605 RepID=A0A7I8K671_SPIIN|nr:unnamed protein product [Spirodela intermedia]